MIDFNTDPPNPNLSIYNATINKSSTEYKMFQHNLIDLIKQ